MPSLPESSLSSGDRKIQNVSLTYDFGGVRYDLASRTHIMGILNVTPDSFSDGGRFRDADRAVRHALEMAEQGADFIDVGGESTRPGSDPVSAEEETARVLPVIERLAVSAGVPISIDTCKAEVAGRALDAGAVIVNDVSGLKHDPRLADVAASRNASIVLMHMQGTPKSMQEEPRYENLIGEIISYLKSGIEFAKSRGVSQIFVDPGIGFGKTVAHNLQILKCLREFSKLGCPLLVGPSRKSFIGKLLDLPVDRRLFGTGAAVAVAVMNGANIVRVHDVSEMKQVALIADAVRNS